VPTPSARLRRKLDLILPTYGGPARLLLEHPRVRELYPAYLATGSYAALVMVPLMETALARARALVPDDPTAAALADYLERHIPEEIHDEEPGGGPLADLEALGVDTVALRSGPVPEKVAALIGTQYFWILQSHPVAILGFLWLEVYPPHAPTIELLIAKTGLPRAGFRQLLLHSELDVGHGEELERVLDSMPLEPHHEQLIAQSALQTMAFLVDAWLDVVADGAVVTS
jgi:hypothetical protein